MKYSNVMYSIQKHNNWKGFFGGRGFGTDNSGPPPMTFIMGVKYLQIYLFIYLPLDLVLCGISINFIEKR